MRVHLSNLGCKLNQAELEALARRLRTAGHQIVDALDEAEVHVVNTCTVTHQAARDSRKLARRGARTDPRIRTVLTGCWATERPDDARSLPGVELVVGNSDKDLLAERILAELGGPGPLESQQSREVLEVPVSYVPLPFDRADGNTRAALKIEDGCNMTCSFCIIPSTRGRQVSRSPEEALAELLQLEQMGYREVVVTGVQISSYRWRMEGQADVRLHDLTRRMLDATSRVRLRLTSIAPWQFDERLIDLWPHERLCRHVHLSLQSGCAETLRRMRRPYTPDQYADLLQRLRDRIPGLAVTTDVIVGFPGETEEEFERSLRFVEQCDFARTHVFTYSERDGTRAVELPDAVPVPARKRRTHRMLEVARSCAQRFEEAQVGSRQTVLWEERRNGALRGTTDNYLRIGARSAGASSDLVGLGRSVQVGRLVPVRVVRGPQGDLVGVAV